jgi:hypothetical protein
MVTSVALFSPLVFSNSFAANSSSMMGPLYFGEARLSPLGIQKFSNSTPTLVAQIRNQYFFHIMQA